jgi:hypothetical protein
MLVLLLGVAVWRPVTASYYSRFLNAKAAIKSIIC